MESIALAYAGVHQIFQLALAAHEMGELDFLCASIFDSPGKLGAHIARHLHSPSAHPLDSEKLPSERVREYPWPFLTHRVVAKLLSQRNSDHHFTNDWFDRHAASFIRQSKAKLFVGAETCALHSMRAAKERGMKCVLDCPGIPMNFLDREASNAAKNWGMKVTPSSNSTAMVDRKMQELELADVILACSEFQKSVLVANGVSAERIRVIPLWVNAGFWRDVNKDKSFSAKPLRVVYAGAVSLRKGVPFLLEAVRLLGDAVTLTLIGPAALEMEPLLRKFPAIQRFPYVPKERLREIYAKQDVLVMPTLGDSFGFVALEAMAAGLPAIASSHCGAPLPDESWRVQAASPEAIAARLQHYIGQPAQLTEDGAIGAAFAAHYTPERYRETARGIFKEMLASPRA